MAEGSETLREYRGLQRRDYLPASRGNEMIRMLNALGQVQIVGKNGQPIGTLTLSQGKAVLRLDALPLTAKDVAALLVSGDAGNDLTTGADGLLFYDAGA